MLRLELLGDALIPKRLIGDRLFAGSKSPVDGKFYHYFLRAQYAKGEAPNVPMIQAQTVRRRPARALLPIRRDLLAGGPSVRRTDPLPSPLAPLNGRPHRRRTFKVGSKRIGLMRPMRTSAGNLMKPSSRSARLSRRNRCCRGAGVHTIYRRLVRGPLRLAPTEAYI